MSLLDPNQRSLYTSLLTPPPGYLFDEAIGATFSLDLTTLLTVPVHLALLAKWAEKDMLGDGVALLESLSRLSNRIGIFCQAGRVQVPDANHGLFGLLESMVVEVDAPKDGVFHPKFWVLRFKSPSDPDEVLLRLAVMSRNLTADQSWDLALTLEGPSRGRAKKSNRPLADMIRVLPDLAIHEVTEKQFQQIERFIKAVRRAEWELPEGFEELLFHPVGIDKYVLTIPQADRMLAISPFLHKTAVSRLSEKTNELILISRPETLNELGEEALVGVNHCFVLDEAAETDDGEDIDWGDRLGLHAKCLVATKGWYTHVLVGSANFTRPALIDATNVELMVELVGKQSKVGGVETVLDQSGLGALLSRAVVTNDEPGESAEVVAERALDRVRYALAASGIHVQCEQIECQWQIVLMPGAAVEFDPVGRWRAWPVTIHEDRSSWIEFPLDSYLELGVVDTSMVTGFVAFELESKEMPGISVRFVLNLPVAGMPEARDAAIMAAVIRNRENFLRYLLLLLTMGNGFEESLNGSGADGFWGNSSFDEIPLLEEMIRAFSRDPDKLRDISRLINKLREVSADESPIPADFLDLWAAFEKALQLDEG